MGLKEEQELKDKYLLTTEEFDGMQIVKLTTDNIARVEAMIMTDSGYAKSGDINACPTYKRNEAKKYFGSTAYWMTELKNHLSQEVHLIYKISLLMQSLLLIMRIVLISIRME